MEPTYIALQHTRDKSANNGLIETTEIHVDDYLSKNVGLRGNVWVKSDEEVV